MSYHLFIIYFPKTSGQFLPTLPRLRRELSDVQRLRREHREAREQLVALRAEAGIVGGLAVK